MRTKSASCRHARILSGALLALLLIAGGCGHRDHDGDIVVDNRTDLTTNELLLTFRVAPFRQPFSADLLGG